MLRKLKRSISNTEVLENAAQIAFGVPKGI